MRCALLQSNALANKVSKDKQEDLKTFCAQFLALPDVDTVQVTSIDRYAIPPFPLIIITLGDKA